MIFHIYANFNILGDFFTSPIVEKITPDEMAKEYKQVISGLEKSILEKLKECDLYCLGTYDNISGVIVPEKTFILHCSDAVKCFLNNGEKKEEVAA